MRECHRDYAHGPMKIRTENVLVEYRGEQYHCPKTVYACNWCDFELQQQWMKDEMEMFLQDAHALRCMENQSR